MDSPKTSMEFMEKFKTENDCRRALFTRRWPQGFSCARCGHARAWAVKSRPLFECALCGQQTAVTAGQRASGGHLTGVRPFYRTCNPCRAYSLS